jgi:hypothetical protein
VLHDLGRLLDLPTPEEAVQLGSLLFDDNAGSEHYEPISGERDAARLASMGPAAFMAMARRRWSFHAAGVRWPQGAVTRAHPEVLVEAHRQVYNDMDYRFFANDLADRAIALGRDTVTIYGGGRIGFEMLAHAERCGIRVDFVVDSNAALHGVSLRGQEIVPLAKAVAEGCQTYVVASIAFAAAITETIRSFYATHNLPPPLILSSSDPA